MGWIQTSYCHLLLPGHKNTTYRYIQNVRDDKKVHKKVLYSLYYFTFNEIPS